MGVRVDEYEAPALAWLFREVKRLDDCLAEGGVIDSEQRRSVCASFFFGMSTSFAEPIEVRGQRYVAEVAMRKEDDVLLATDLFDFHEYAVSIVDEVYDAT